MMAYLLSIGERQCGAAKSIERRLAEQERVTAGKHYGTTSSDAQLRTQRTPSQWHCT